MNHEKIWDAVDNLAKKNNLSPSGLAKKAGLDSTTFNKSKRIRADGKHRFPSLDSLQKITDACNISFEEFYNLSNIKENTESPSNIPYVELSILEKNTNTINSKDCSKKIKFPDNRNNLYAVEIDKNELDYQLGTILIVTQNSDIRRNDKTIIRLKNDSSVLGKFVRRTAKTIELSELSKAKKDLSIRIDDIKEINRILWISQ